MSDSLSSWLDATAQSLLEGHLGDVASTGLSDELRPGNIRDAYLIQDRVVNRLAELRGEPSTGHKIGGTSSVMQSYLGLDNPCAGRLVRVEYKRGKFRTRAATTLGVECEIAVRLAANLPPRDAPYSVAEVGAAVGSSMAAIEVVEDRFVDWRAVDTPTLIADNFFHHGAVLGPERGDVDPVDLGAAVASMSIDGVTVGTGVGTDLLGHPLEALCWLANHASWHGSGLSAGEVVLLGSVVETHWVQAGSVVRIENDLLGAAEAVFLAPEGG